MKVSNLLATLGVTAILVGSQMIGLPPQRLEKAMACSRWNPFCTEGVPEENTSECNAVGMCEGGGLSNSRFNLQWSQAGPISGMQCVRVHEDADPHAWSDNYLCSDRNLGLRWSQAGPISGMQCVRVHEDADPHAWSDNYLCSDRNLGLRWSQAGPISGMRCVRVHEDADPHAWSDNYLCYPS